MSECYSIDPEHLKLIHPFNFICSGPSQSGKSSFVLKLIDNLPLLTTPPVENIIYIYNSWQEKFDSYKNRVFFTDKLKYLACRPSQPTLLICDDHMTDLHNSKELLDLFIKNSHHHGISVLLILQNIFEKGRIFKSLRQNCHYYYLTEHLQDRQSIEYFARQLEPKNSKYFIESYDDAVSKPYRGLFCDLHPHSKLRALSKYRTGVENEEGQTLYIPKNS